MDIINLLVFYLKLNVSETGFYLCFQVEHIRQVPIDRANPYLRA
jgi:hypothetical protein